MNIVEDFVNRLIEDEELTQVQRLMFGFYIVSEHQTLVKELYCNMVRKGIDCKLLYDCYKSNQLDELFEKKHKKRSSKEYKKWKILNVKIGETCPEPAKKIKIDTDDICSSCYRQGFLENRRIDSCSICKRSICVLCSYEHEKYGMICYIHSLLVLSSGDKNRTKDIRKLINSKLMSYEKIDKKIDCLDCHINEENKLTVAYIMNLLEEQRYICFICEDQVLTENYTSNCEYQFSIDRINNNLPHIKNNVRITCKYCNCRRHALLKYGNDVRKMCKYKCHTARRILKSKYDILKPLFPYEPEYWFC